MVAIYRSMLALALILVASVPASAQGLSDLTDDKKGTKGGTNYDLRVGRDRVDLALSPHLRLGSYPEKKSISFGFNADLKFVCGDFDLKASFQHLLSKEAREDYLDGILDMLVQELLGQGMELLCQAEPTLCTLLQNYSVTANMKVSYYKDLCQQIENALIDANKKNAAAGIEACLKEKEKQGVPLSLAYDQCAKEEPQLRGFDGKLVAELDLTKELRSLLGKLGISSDGQDLASGLAENTRIDGKGMSSDANPNAISSIYEKIQKKYIDKLNNVVGKAAAGEKLTAEDLGTLVPKYAPPIAADEVWAISLLTPQKRSVAIHSLATALTIFELTMQIHEVERAFEAIKGAPTVDDAKRSWLEDRLVRLRKERTRLVERYQDQKLVADALTRVRLLSDKAYRRKVGQLRSRTGLYSYKKNMLKDVTPYGLDPARVKPRKDGGSVLQGGGGCTYCGGSVSFGSYGGGK